MSHMTIGIGFPFVLFANIIDDLPYVILHCFYQKGVADKMKYVIFLNGEVCVFPESVGHNFIAGGRPVRSAGFCRIETFRDTFDDVRATVSVWGRSDTLNVNSNPDDKYDIAQAFHQ